MPEENKAIVRRIVEEVWNEGDPSAIDELVVANYEDHSLPPGMPPGVEGLKQIKVKLPEVFVFENPTDFPIAGAGSSPDCAPGNLQCSTAVLLQGWPQNPIRPPFLKYSLDFDEATNTLIFTALEDLGPNKLDTSEPEPGIKQMHLILNGFTNPKPGRYQIEVTAETGPDGAEEHGVGSVHIIPG